MAVVMVMVMVGAVVLRHEGSRMVGGSRRSDGKGLLICGLGWPWWAR